MHSAMDAFGDICTARVAKHLHATWCSGPELLVVTTRILVDKQYQQSNFMSSGDLAMHAALMTSINLFLVFNGHSGPAELLAWLIDTVIVFTFIRESVYPGV